MYKRSFFIFIAFRLLTTNNLQSPGQSSDPLLSTTDPTITLPVKQPITTMSNPIAIPKKAKDYFHLKLIKLAKDYEISIKEALLEKCTTLSFILCESLRDTIIDYLDDNDWLALDHLNALVENETFLAKLLFADCRVDEVEFEALYYYGPGSDESPDIHGFEENFLWMRNDYRAAAAIIPQNDAEEIFLRLLLQKLQKYTTKLIRTLTNPWDNIAKP